jgi:hypothetical protein
VNVNHVAIVNLAGPQLDTELALAVDAIRTEVPTFCQHWGLPPIGVAFYGANRRQDLSEQAVICVVSRTEDPSAFARHSQLGKAIYGYVDAGLCAAEAEPLSRPLSHEFWEMGADPGLDQMEPQPDGTSILREVSDPVNRVGLTVEAEFFGRHGHVALSNYVLPSWFVPGSAGPWDRCGILEGPLTCWGRGHYQVVRAGVIVASGPSPRITSFGRTFRRLAAAR